MSARKRVWALIKWREHTGHESHQLQLALVSRTYGDKADMWHCCSKACQDPESSAMLRAEQWFPLLPAVWRSQQPWLLSIFI
jgi:hypothetical protein